MKKLALLAMLALASCNPTPKEKMEEMPTKAIVTDVHTFAQPQEALMTHLDLDVKVDFDAKTIAGTAKVRFDRKPGAKQLVLDTQKLAISKVTDGTKDLSFQLKENVPYLGQALVIELPEGISEVTVHYSSSPEADALQWLSPAQTGGKKNPFLFTQSQSILARSWVPCQDSPGIRFTYTAKVHVPSNLMALMSAENPQALSPDGIYNFNMDKPIPAYLLSMAVGDVQFKAIGPRTGVYAEPALLEKSANEFADLENMLTSAENLYGKYQWGRYDLIVLPPSFPFGGMENPRITFATPTILAGDRSLVALVAHELAHSWSGNLVTNATWNDFWLNEGFTVYFENRIMEALYGKPIADMLALISYQDVEEAIAEMKANGKGADTRLKLELKGRNPDDGVSPIAYDKGFFLLKLIEETVGREKWDAFLKKYFADNQFKTMNTEDFLVYIDKNLLQGVPGAKEKIRLEEWIYKEGLPDNCPTIVSDKFDVAGAQATAFMAGGKASELDTKDWTFQQWVFFLRSLPTGMTKAQMTDLDKTFAFTKSGNSEILAQWLLQVIASQYTPAYPKLEDFCFNVGRRKFIGPLYRAMMANEATQPLAKKIYAKSRPNYHSVAYNTLDGVVK